MYLKNATDLHAVIVSFFADLKNIEPAKCFSPVYDLFKLVYEKSN